MDFCDYHLPNNSLFISYVVNLARCLFPHDVLVPAKAVELYLDLRKLVKSKEIEEAFMLFSSLKKLKNLKWMHQKRSF